MGREIKIVGVNVCHYFFWAKIKPNTHLHAVPRIPEDMNPNIFSFHLLALLDIAPSSSLDPY